MGFFIDFFWGIVMKENLSFILSVRKQDTEHENSKKTGVIDYSLWCRGIARSALSLQASDGAKTVYFPNGDVMVRYLKDAHPELKTSMFVEDVTSNADKYLLSADMSAYKKFFIKEASDNFKKAYTNREYHFDRTAISVISGNMYQMFPLSYFLPKDKLDVIVISCDQDGMYHAHRYSILCTSIWCEHLLSGGDIGELNEFIFGFINY